MDERRARIHDDLRDVFGGELLLGSLDRAPYAVDASLFEIDPLGIVVPRTYDDLRAVLRYAAEDSLPLHPRGSGTGPVGGSLGPGLVVDFSRHFRRVLAVGAEDVTVQAGVTLEELNAQLAPLGRRIGPEPGDTDAGTLGGMIAGDASGPRSLRYGTMADHVQALRVIFASGDEAALHRGPWRPHWDDDPEDFADRVARRVGALLDRHAERIARTAPRSPRDRAGYALGAARVPGGGVDLARLIVGSEGTLALIVEATVRTVPIPAAQAVVALPFGRLADAAAAVPDCLKPGPGPSSCELLDWRWLSLARDAGPEFRAWVPEAAEAMLIVEFEGDDPAEVAGRARALARRPWRGLAGDPVETARRAEGERLRRLRRAVRPLLLRLKGPARAVPFPGDLAVPVAALPEAVRRLQDLFKEHEVDVILHAHAGTGQLHATPFLDLGDPRHRAHLEPLAAAVAEAALDLGGSITGEHGCGLGRATALRRQCGELIHVFREVKAAFDPHDLLNPGKIFVEDPEGLARSLRAMPASAIVTPAEPPGEADAPALPILETALRWGERGAIEEAVACNGCGACRVQDPSLRMCPTFRALRSEAAAPRAKATLLRQFAAGALDPKLWGTEELKEVADLCVHCHLCQGECPAGVDVSSLMLEAKAAYVETHGLTPSDWLLSRVETWAKLGSLFPAISNALLASRPARWALERFLGLSRHRCLPRVHRAPFLRRAERSGYTTPRPHEPGPRVAYFVDVFANYFDQELAEATLAVLRHAGVNVYVPKGQRGCGMPALVAGDVDRARAFALANLRVLGDAVRDGYTVVCTEPTAALMIRREYPKLTDDLDAALVAENTMDVGQYLAGLDARGLLPRPHVPLGARVGYHQPCHLRALEVGRPGLDLIRAIPELDVEFIDRGCSGMAGTFGLARQNFRNSLRAGRGLLSRLRDPDLDLGATECGTCRMQMEQGVAKRTVHPMKLLSLSYGLNPSLRRHLKDPKPRHIVS